MRRNRKDKVSANTLSLVSSFMFNKRRIFVAIYVSYQCKNHRMAIINRIKAVLAEKQLTSKWLAERLEKSENTVSKWCSNKVQPSLRKPR